MTIIIVAATIILTSIIWYFIFVTKIKNLQSEKSALANDLNNLSVHVDYKINQEAIAKTQQLNDKIVALKQEMVKAEKESYFAGRNEYCGHTPPNTGRSKTVQAQPLAAHQHKTRHNGHVAGKRT